MHPSIFILFFYALNYPWGGGPIFLNFQGGGASALSCPPPPPPPSGRPCFNLNYVYMVYCNNINKTLNNYHLIIKLVEYRYKTTYSMCSLVVSVLDSPAVDPRSNPGSGSALLMSEKSQAVYYISSCHMLITKRSPVTSQTVTGSRLTGFLSGLGSSTVDQVLKYTKYPKYIPSTSTGQVFIF